VVLRPYLLRRDGREDIMHSGIRAAGLEGTKKYSDLVDEIIVYFDGLIKLEKDDEVSKNAITEVFFQHYMRCLKNLDVENIQPQREMLKILSRPLDSCAIIEVDVDLFKRGFCEALNKLNAKFNEDTPTSRYIDGIKTAWLESLYPYENSKKTYNYLEKFINELVALEQNVHSLVAHYCTDQDGDGVLPKSIRYTLENISSLIGEMANITADALILNNINKSLVRPIISALKGTQWEIDYFDVLHGSEVSDEYLNLYEKIQLIIKKYFGYSSVDYAYHLLQMAALYETRNSHIPKVLNISNQLTAQAIRIYEKHNTNPIIQKKIEEAQAGKHYYPSHYEGGAENDDELPDDD
jgi:hypothetical protein